ncbi:MAG: hypothetical protein R3B72_07420 [Polyangiaceae bacterium]
MTFDPWKQTTHDPNDTAKPGQRWYDLMKAGTGAEQAAADKTTLHADTPTVTYFDALARPVVVRAHNRLGPTLIDEFHETKSVLDVQGNLLQLIDARGIPCMRLTHGMLGQLLKQVSTDAGTRWTLTTAAGQPVTFGASVASPSASRTTASADPPRSSCTTAAPRPRRAPLLR